MYHLRNKSKPQKSECGSSEDEDILPLRERIRMSGMGRGLLASSSTIQLQSSSVKANGRGLLRYTNEQRQLPGEQHIPRVRRPAATNALRALWNIAEDDSGDDLTDEMDADEETVIEENDSNNDDSVSESESDDSSDDLIGVVIATSDEHGSVQRGKDGTNWKKKDMNLEQRGRQEQHNVYSGKSGCSAKTLREVNVDDYSSAFHLLFDGSMIRHIVKCTEKEAHRQLNNQEWKVSVEEMEAFIGLLYIRGVCGCSKIKLDKLWGQTWGISIFSSTIPRDRFRQIMRFLRFDEKSTRSERLKNDKFTMISWLFTRFVENSQAAYYPNVNVTIDEQLLPSKCRCPFTQYMSNKPDKFGIKFWLLCDTETKYMQNAIPYLGKDELRPVNKQLGHHVVMELMKPYYGKGHNVTSDNFFTSLALAKDLKGRRCSLVGTCRWGRRELPTTIYGLQEKMARYDSQLFIEESQTATLTLYKSKPRKAVLILSSQHSGCRVEESHQKRLPETVSFYNKTKHGVDIFDQMTRLYTTKAQSRRWPVHVFYNLLDFAGINSWILFKKSTARKVTRSDYLLGLGEQLCNRFISIKRVANSIPYANIQSQVRRQCQVSPHHNKTTETCSMCNRLCCGSCVGNKQITVICYKCTEEQ